MLLGPMPFWIAFGLIVGLLARWIVPGESPGGVFGDIVVGILGTFAGIWLYGRFGHNGEAGLNLPTMVYAFIGAVVLLWLLRLTGGRSTA